MFCREKPRRGWHEGVPPSEKSKEGEGQGQVMEEARRGEAR